MLSKVMLQRREIRWFGGLLLAFGTMSCGGDDNGTSQTTEGLTIPCDVQRVLEAKCQRCHGDPQQNGAPFPLLTLEHFHADYFDVAIHQRAAMAVESGFMPLPSTTIMPPVLPLTDEEKTILLDWLNAGAEGVMATCD